MNLDANSLLAGLLVSSIGCVLLMYGRRQGRAPQFVCGIALLVYPYFVGSALAILLIALPLLFLMWLALRAGY